MGTPECATLHPCCFEDIKVNIVHLLCSIKIIYHSVKFRDDYVYSALLLYIPIPLLHNLAHQTNCH